MHRPKVIGLGVVHSFVRSMCIDLIFMGTPSKSAMYSSLIVGIGAGMGSVGISYSRTRRSVTNLCTTVEENVMLISLISSILKQLIVK